MTPEQAEIERARTAHIERTTAHYFHAREKHPYFADKISPGVCPCNENRPGYALAMCREGLAASRRRLSLAAEKHEVSLMGLLECEMFEIFEAFESNDTAQAVSECYDAIAVLLRAVDVLEGRQKLGKPEKEGNI